MADEPLPPDRRFIIDGGFVSGAYQLYPNVEQHIGAVVYTPAITSKNDEVRVARSAIVRGARQLERSNEQIRAGLDRYADMVTGPSIRVHPQPDWETLGIDDLEVRKSIVTSMRREFNNWAYDARLLCDGEGHYNFGGMMWMALRNLNGPDGECAVVVHYDEQRAARLKARWATYITVIDPDRIETPPEQAADVNVFEGRKMDAEGRFIGMYVRRKHPSEGGTSLLDFEYVPRETDFGRPMALHWFMKTRGMQQRGMSALALIIKPSTMLRKFDESYLAAAIVNSQLATYIKTKSSPGEVAERLAPAPGAGAAVGGMDYFGQKLNYYDRTKFKVGAGGRLAILPPDDEIVMTAVNRGIDDPNPFRNGLIREQASAVGNGFEQYALNYSESNYSSARAQELQTHRGVLRVRVMFSGHVCSPIYGCVIEEAIAKGRITLPAGSPPFQEYRTAWTAATWTGPGMSQIDPQKEANAWKTLVDLKVTSRGRVAAAMGDDIFEIFAEIENEQSVAEELEITLDALMPGQEDPNAMQDAAEISASGVPKTKAKRKGAGGAPARDGDGDGQVDEKGNQ